MCFLMRMMGSKRRHTWRKSLKWCVMLADQQHLLKHRASSRQERRNCNCIGSFPQQESWQCSFLITLLAVGKAHPETIRAHSHLERGIVLSWLLLEQQLHNIHISQQQC